MIAAHCSTSSPAPRGREHREVGRRAVRVDVGEAAEDPAPRRRTPRAPPPRSRRSRARGSAGKRSHVMAVSNVSASTPIATSASRRYGAPRNALAPGADRVPAAAARDSSDTAPPCSAQSSSARAIASVHRMVGRLEAEHEQRVGAVAGHRQLAPRRRRAGGSWTGAAPTGEIARTHSAPARKLAKRTPAERRCEGRGCTRTHASRDHAERSLRAGEHPVGADAGARSGQPPRLPHARRA